MPYHRARETVPDQREDQGQRSPLQASGKSSGRTQQAFHYREFHAKRPLCSPTPLGRLSTGRGSACQKQAQDHPFTVRPPPP